MLTNEFKKSSISMIYHNCVVCKLNDKSIHVAHSRDHEKTILYSIPEWEAFIEGVKNGEFDIGKK